MECRIVYPQHVTRRQHKTSLLDFEISRTQPTAHFRSVLLDFKAIPRTNDSSPHFFRGAEQAQEGGWNHGFTCCCPLHPMFARYCSLVDKLE
jgi:hypothetical protein